MYRLLSTFIRKSKSLYLNVLRRTAFLIFERFLPIDDRLWCFCTWERHFHTLDNPRAVLEAIRETDPSVVIVVLQKRRSTDGAESRIPGIRFVLAESLAGAFYLARSRVVLLAYGLRGLSSYATGLTAKHLIVQLWHGIPLRRIGRLFPRETWWSKETPRYGAMVASTERERKNLSEAFSPLPLERIWVTGLPRNDLLLGPEAGLPPDYGDQLTSLREQLKGRRLVLYAPTWRDREQDHYSISPTERDSLGRLLRKHDAVFGIRGHWNVRHLAAYRDDASIDEIITLDHFPDVNLILRETAVLVSDYSSIYLDFLLTDRPIIHFVYDFDRYLQSRVGFLYTTEEAFAGPTPRTFDDLLTDLHDALSPGWHGSDSQKQARELFHQHPERSALEVSRRIAELSGQSIT